MKKFALLFLLATSPACGETINVYGVGMHKCGTLYELSESQLAGWVGGFINGANATASTLLKRKEMDLTGDLDRDIILGAVKAYCRKNPNSYLHLAAQSVVGGLLSNVNR